MGRKKRCIYSAYLKFSFYICKKGKRIILSVFVYEKTFSSRRTRFGVPRALCFYDPSAHEQQGLERLLRGGVYPYALGSAQKRKTQPYSGIF